MKDRRRVLGLILVMACVSLIVVGLTLYLLYDAAFEQQKERLQEIVRSQARLIEAVAESEELHSREDHPDGWEAATLGQIRNAHGRYQGFGASRGFLLVRRQGESIEIRHTQAGPVGAILVSGPDADFLRRPLEGESGVGVGTDYRGERVLAAYEPVSRLGWGLVAQIELNEVRAPFVRAGLVAALVAVVLVSLGSAIIFRLSVPLLARLKMSEARFRGIVETAADAIVTIDGEGTIVMVNPACERAFGYSEEELVGKNVTLLMPEPYHTEHRDYIADYLRTGKRAVIGTIGREAEARRKDGTVFPVELSVSEVRFGKRRLFTGILRDVTERKTAEKKFLEQESLAKLGEVAAIVAHEVKNPLAGIIGAGRMLGRSLPEGSTEREIAEELASRAESLNESVKDILNYSRPQTPVVRPICVKTLLEGALSLVSEDPLFKGVDLSLTAPDVDIACDEEMLRPVLLNLLMNAAEAMEGSGSLRIFAEAKSSDDGFCRISLRDTGPGIPETKRERIFEPFFTTKGAGTGLGLPIARRVVELHGGHISVACPVEGGTEVTVEMPRADSHSSP